MIAVVDGAVAAPVREVEGAVGVADTAFATVYEAHAAAVYRYCLARLGDPSTAEDAAAEAFSNAYSAWPRFRDDRPDAVRRWLFRIAGNAVTDSHRRRQRRLRLLGRIGSNGHMSSTDVEAVAALRGELRSVLEAASRLTDRDRELLGLRVAAGLSHAEVALALGMSEQAARTATHRALARLRSALEAG